jgi:hypothetical protein
VAIQVVKVDYKHCSLKYATVLIFFAGPRKKLRVDDFSTTDNEDSEGEGPANEEKRPHLDGTDPLS